jgi:dehydrogenase/reductase SDR family protein 4
VSNNNRIRQKFDLTGKVALVTGASKGIGEAMARGMAEFGATVVVSSRKQEELNAVVDAFKQDGLEAIAIVANVSNPEDLDALIEQTVERCAGIDVLINNAAANPVFGPIQNTDQRAFDKILDVNLRGPFELCKRVYPIMKARGGGSIINISSIGGVTPEAGIGIYSASKAAILNLTQAMAQDWGSDNIRINAICPGLIRTKFSEALWGNEDILNRFLKHTPLGRPGEADEVAGLATFLASDAASYCTGGVYMVDGGYLAN